MLFTAPTLARSSSIETGPMTHHICTIHQTPFTLLPFCSAHIPLNSLQTQPLTYKLGASYTGQLAYKHQCLDATGAHGANPRDHSQDV